MLQSFIFVASPSGFAGDWETSLGLGQAMPSEDEFLVKGVFSVWGIFRNGLKVGWTFF